MEVRGSVFRGKRSGKFVDCDENNADSHNVNFKANNHISRHVCWIQQKLSGILNIIPSTVPFCTSKVRSSSNEAASMKFRVSNTSRCTMMIKIIEKNVER